MGAGRFGELLEDKRRARQPEIFIMKDRHHHPRNAKSHNQAILPHLSEKFIFKGANNSFCMNQTFKKWKF